MPVSITVRNLSFTVNVLRVVEGGFELGLRKGMCFFSKEHSFINVSAPLKIAKAHNLKLKAGG